MNPEQMKTREEELLEDEDVFKRNAFMLIEEMMDLNENPSEYTTLLVDEILHSIFFLGKMKTPPYTPQIIVNDDEMYDELKSCYPRPFELCSSSQLPKRSPFSCVLDMIVHLEGQQNEDMIIERLQLLIKQLKKGDTDELVSSTICVSQDTSIPNAVRYYGVSMSTTGCNPGQIMVAASCFSTWDNYVADAVMTYYPTKAKKQYFDGTIQFPKNIRCQAFNLSTGVQRPPCRSCGNLFGLMTSECKEWAYGNCAEAESLSNLLKGEGNVKAQARPTSEMWTDENRQRAEEDVLNHLRDVLRRVRFRWNNAFYTPQTEHV